MAHKLDFNVVVLTPVQQQQFTDIKRQLDTAPLSAGRENLKKHLSGDMLNLRQRIVAKCCDCMAYHTDGKMDCEIPACPLYPLMPYGKQRKIRNQIKAV